MSRKVLILGVNGFIGNSLTNHGPSAAVGWSGNWGMAASAATLDYKNQVVSKLGASTARIFLSSVVSANQVEKALSESAFDATSLLSAVRPGQDIVVLQFGDNVPLNTASQGR